MNVRVVFVKSDDKRVIMIAVPEVVKLPPYAVPFSNKTPVGLVELSATELGNYNLIVDILVANPIIVQS